MTKPYGYHMKNNKRAKRIRRKYLQIENFILFSLILACISYILSFSVIIRMVTMSPFPKLTKTKTNIRHATAFSNQSSIINNKFNTTLLNDPPVIFHGPRDTKRIALTFDADMTQAMKSELLSGKVKSWYNDKIIAILTNTKTKATMFLTGMWIELYPQITHKLATDPLFEVGNHSYSHPSFYGICYGLKPLADSKDQEEIVKTQKLLQKYGGATTLLFRFPGGCYDSSDISKISKLGFRVIQWDIVSGDGFLKSPEQIEQQVLHNVQNGSIIVFHLHGNQNAPYTAEALPMVIKTLKEKGYVFVKLSELIDTSNPQSIEKRQSINNILYLTKN
jgi:peptidoglycan-N-acetylglucosamine deacetylase